MQVCVLNLLCLTMLFLNIHRPPSGLLECVQYRFSLPERILFDNASGARTVVIGEDARTDGFTGSPESNLPASGINFRNNHVYAQLRSDCPEIQDLEDLA